MAVWFTSHTRKNIQFFGLRVPSRAWVVVTQALIPSRAGPTFKHFPTGSG